MKCALVLLVAMAMMVCLAQTQPICGETSKPKPLVQVKEVLPEEDADEVEPEESHTRHKRATCDLLSKFNVNHSACAAHCLTKGFKGGFCNEQAVCNCRN